MPIPFAGFTNSFEIIIGMGRFPNFIISVYNEHTKLVADILDSVAYFNKKAFL